MKKTLTVNLGGTVFHIDEDAYRLLDNYLSNLKLHFRSQEGAEEIVDDIERRISELFAEKLTAGQQVITIADVEEVITRMGKPEEMESETVDDDGNREAKDDANGSNNGYSTTEGAVHKRLYRNPDDKMLGGVVSGLAVYLNWDVTLLRMLLLVLLVCGVGTLVPVYIVCWLLIPEAKTAAEKLSMRGEAITLKNIGKTVTDGYEKVANGVNNFVNSGKSRTFLQKAGDALVMVAGWVLKIGLVLFAIFCGPVLFALLIALVALIFAVGVVILSGGAALVELFPTAVVNLPAEPISAIVFYIAGILMICIPMFALVWGILSAVLKWQPMNTGLKWTLVILWIVSCACFGICFAMQGATVPDMEFYFKEFTALNV